MIKRKLFLQIRSINIAYPNVKNMIVMPIAKRMEIIMCIQVCLISRKNFDYMENGEKKAFPSNPKINIGYPKVENMIVVPITKIMEINMSIQICLILQMNYDRKENCWKKAFLSNPKHQYSVSQYGEHDCCANNKKNWDCYKYPSLSHFTDELLL